MEVAAEVWVKLTGSRLFKNRLANSRAILVLAALFLVDILFVCFFCLSRTSPKATTKKQPRETCD